MRKVRKTSEQRAIVALKELLVSRGKMVSEDESFIDNPDAVLEIDGVRVAVECTIMSPEKVMEYHGIRREKGKLNQLFLPQEPHMWLKKAIESKQDKIQQYIQSSLAEQVWLIAHNGSATGIEVGELESTWEVVGYAYGAYITENSFDRIYVVDDLKNDIVCVYSREKGYCVKEIADIAFPPENKIPVSILFFGDLVVQILENGKKGIRADLNNPGKRLCLQPIDAEYSVDYSGVESLSFANIGHGKNPPPLIYAYKNEGE